MVNTREKQSRQIKIPLPQVPSGLQPEARQYLESLKRALEENLRTLFYKEAVDGERIADGSIPDEALETPPVTINFDIPFPSGLNIRKSGSDVIWDAGTIDFGGTTHSVASGSRTPSNDGGIYWDSASPTVLSYVEPPAVSPGDTKWFLASYDSSGNVSESFGATIIHAGLLQSDTVLARQINTTDLFAQNLVINNTGNIRMGKTSYSSTLSGFWLGDDSGTAKFHIGDSNYYFKWDGTDVEIQSKKGLIGNSTDYFDITDGALQFKHPSHSRYVYIASQDIIISASSGGSGTKYVNIGPGACSLTALPSAFAGYTFLTSGSSKLGAAEISSTGDVEFLMKGLSATYFHVDEFTSTYSIDGMTLSNCTIDDTCTIDGDAIGDIDGSSITSGNIPAARMEDQVVAALNAASGTIDSDLMPVDAVGVKCGTYTGNGSNLNISLGTGNAAEFVIVKANTGSKGSVAAIIYSGNSYAFNLNNTTNPNQNGSIARHTDGFTVKNGGTFGSDINVNTIVYHYTAFYFLG